MVAKINLTQPKQFEIPEPETQSNHDLLCEIGRKWALRAPSSLGGNMHLSFSEIGCERHKENPDVFAMHSHGDTIVVEAKASRSDFLADKRKPFRDNPDQGMGDFRYYICPTNLITPEDLKGTKWGLIYVDMKRKHCKVIRGHVLNKNVNKREENDLRWRFKKNFYAEADLKTSLLIRMGLNFDLNGLVQTIKVNAKYNGLLMRQDAQAQLINQHAKLDTIKLLKRVIKSKEGSGHCQRCIDRETRDIRKMTRWVNKNK